MPRRLISDLHRPDAAFAALAVEAAQAGDHDGAERMARLAERFGRLKLQLEPGALQRLSRMRAVEVRLDMTEQRLRPLIQLLEEHFGRKPPELPGPPAPPE